MATTNPAPSQKVTFSSQPSPQVPPLPTDKPSLPIDDDAISNSERKMQEILLNEAKDGKIEEDDLLSPVKDFDELGIDEPEFVKRSTKEFERK